MEKQLSYQNLTTEDYESLNQSLAEQDTVFVLRWAYERWGKDLVYACSFGAEAMVLIDLISKVNPKAELIFIDTDLHFPETYQLIDAVKARYPELKIEMVKATITLQEQAQKESPELWKKEPDRCCQIRKMVPLEKALHNYSAWLSGLRREQSQTRQHIQFINPDNRFGKVKVCPLIHWTWEEVWMYIRLHQLPYNELHDQRYPSIGCAPCTAPVDEDGDSRAGRWAGQSKTECGLHR
ncbi:phosphoadenylyl-sulfate reductase [Heliorestis convoluta]|uniref:Adenosine 5'-phosphosulfate reductase n=1 Tax=Heliorestis convoluta TaxID=356322 RepID=A0A5Q2MY32_9FIRM|nr:phosphoadenylyl-sulfate reductase [Heliorestis convoluta]QGG47608.1 phosophoadenylyl-sulfate reductase [Heliorestis convoluta]